MKQILLLVVGAVAGGILGYFAVFWLLKHGLYALALPGGLVGLGATLGRTRSVVVAALCGLAATALGLFTEWRFFEHFPKDPSLGYFLLHAYQLDALTLVMIAVGGLIGFWLPYSRAGSDRRPDQWREPRQAPEGDQAKEP
jgi:hypothetical protein